METEDFEWEIRANDVPYKYHMIGILFFHINNLDLSNCILFSHLLLIMHYF